MSLVVIGRDPRNHSVWINYSSDTYPLSPSELATMRQEVAHGWFATRAGHTFDESDVNELLWHMRNGSDLDDCRHCTEPAPFESDGGWICIDHLDALSNAENGYDEAVRGA